MSRYNAPFQVLVTTGDQAVLAAGNKPEDLAPGQVGIFSVNTGLSISAAEHKDAREFYLAVGLDEDGDTVTDNIMKSAGQSIQRAGIASYNTRCYNPALPKIVDLTNFKADCNTEYGIKFEFRNDQIYKNYGFNQLTKTFIVTTACCDDDCSQCPDGDCNELAQLIVAAVNADPDEVISAQGVVHDGSLDVTAAPTVDGVATVTLGADVISVALLAADTIADASIKIAAAIVASGKYGASSDGVSLVSISDSSAFTVAFAAGTTGATAATPVNSVESTVADIPAYAAANPGVCVGVRFTTEPAKVAAYCNINLKYYNPRQTNIIPALVEGFSCNGDLETIQELCYEEGSGYDVQWLEYDAGGYNGRPGPYRAKELAGVPTGNFTKFADAAETYLLLSLSYDNTSKSGFGTYENTNETVIAIPCDDSTTRDELVTVLDGILTNSAPFFGPLLDDVQGCPACGTHESTSEIDDPDEDGIG